MKVAVLGLGVVGASWAALFALRGGHTVTAWDPSDAARAAFDSRLGRARRQLVELGAEDRGAIRSCEHLEDAITGAEWVQESAPEDAGVKRELYAEVESGVSQDTIIATSTSSYTWSDLAATLRRPSRFLIAHPFNPPHLIPLVELYSPEPEVSRRALQFFRELGSVPVCLRRDAVGHIGNRLASALWREAVHVVAEGIADVGDVDRVLIHGPGLRWSVVGTHLGYHLGGGEKGIRQYLSHLGASQERRWASLGTPKLTPELCERLAQGVHAFAAGRSVEQLESERDGHLISILRERRSRPTIDATACSAPPPVRTTMSSEHEINQVLDTYFDGLYRGDTARLRAVFHPQAALFGDVRGAPYQNTLDGWLEAVAKRRSPFDLGEAFRMRVLGIEVIQEIAYAKAQCPMLGFNYVDYLSLLRQDGRWLITNKLFTHVAEQGA
jgi:3-hydroxyacyl-CoA dehydrogenase